MNGVSKTPLFHFTFLRLGFLRFAAADAPRVEDASIALASFIDMPLSLAIFLALALNPVSFVILL